MSLVQPSGAEHSRSPCRQGRLYDRREPSPNRAAGFTLIEVLVVVAIIALIISILIPALKQAREQSTGVVCQSNMHQVTLGMLAYTSEYGRLPGNNAVFWLAWDRSGRPGAGWPTWKPSDSWLGMRDPEHAFPTTEQDQLWAHIDATVPRMGSLYRFVRNEQVYLCPKDHKGMPEPEDPGGGGGNGRFSYTMNSWLGFRSPESLQAFTYVARFATAAGAFPPKVAYIESGTTIKWAPSQMPLLIEEHPWNNTNHGWVGDTWAADSYLVLRHFPRRKDGRANFAFLDGHTEIRLYPYVADQPAVRGGDVAKLQGLDIFNQYSLPYSYDGNQGGAVNEQAFAYKFTYPYND